MISIRAAVVGDAAELTRIAHAAKSHWGYPDEWIRLWAPDLTVRAGTFAEQTLHCAALEGRIVGFYGLSREGDDFELEHMWVDPAVMGRGVGALLFRHATEVVATLGGRRLRIASDPNAEGFYVRMGARRVGDVPSRPEGRKLPLLLFDVDPA